MSVSNVALIAAGAWLSWLVVQAVIVAATLVRRRVIGALALGGVREPIPDGVRSRVLRTPSGRRRVCRSCWRRLAVHAGHIWPYRLGGLNSGGMLIPQCERCNLSQGSRVTVPQLWRLLMPGLGWRNPVPGPVLLGLLVAVGVWWMV